MIITLGLLASMTTATPLHPYNVNKLDNVVTEVHVMKDTTIHLSHTSEFEIVVDKGSDAIKAQDGMSSMDVKVKKGETLHISALSGYTKDTYYKVGSVRINVRNYKNLGY